VDTNQVKLTGTVDKVDLREVGQRGTSLLEILLAQETESWDGQPEVQHTPIQCLGKKADQLFGSLVIGQKIAVKAKLESRAWQDKHFINCTILDIKVLEESKAKASTQSATDGEYFADKSETQDDEVPF
jgi:primosomal replication protein N